MKNEKLIPLKEMAAILGGMRPETLAEYVKRGTVPYYQIGKKCLFDVEKVKAAIEIMKKKDPEIPEKDYMD